MLPLTINLIGGIDGLFHLKNNYFRASLKSKTATRIHI